MEFDRLENPLDLQPGLDELPGFIPDSEYMLLRDDCSKAYEILKRQRKPRYSMKELKEIIDVFSVLAKKADKALRFYAANDAFVFLYYDLCERYAELDAYWKTVESQIKFWNDMEKIVPVHHFNLWEKEFSAIYENTYFVSEFQKFRYCFESVQEACWFLEYDTKLAQRAIREYEELRVIENLTTSTYWGYRYGDLFERVRENLGLEYLSGMRVDDHLHLFGFAIAKKDLRELLQFVDLMADYYHQILKLHTKIDR